MPSYFVDLNNGVKMPTIGLGVYKTTEKKDMFSAVKNAVEAGYRSFDTAQMYKNEALLSDALKKTNVPRSELFITSKVDTGMMGFENTIKSFEESLQRLNTDYLDLFLIHWPGQDKQRCVSTWKAMESIYHKGMVRAIGVCNFHKRHLDWLLEECQIVPAVNQIERHPLLNQKGLDEYCLKNCIQLEAWSPLIRGKLDIPEIVELSKKYKKTPAQIVLRWDIQSGYIVIPKSVHKERILENYNIFDFEISQDDMRIIDSLDNGYRVGPDPDVHDF